MALALSAAAASAATFTVSNTNDSGPGSLRQAILDANNAPGPDTVAFDIPATPRTIALLSTLPVIDANTTVDGTTQPGYAGSPMVQVIGTLFGFDVPAARCFKVAGTLRGMSIGECEVGIEALGGTAKIVGNWIGVDPAGAAAGNSNGLIGTGGTIAQNLFSANFVGASLSGAPQITSNRFGTNPAGTAAMPNSEIALAIAFSSGSAVVSGNTFAGGGPSPIKVSYGIDVQSSDGVTIANNTVGVLPNGQPAGFPIAVRMLASNHTLVTGNIVANSGWGLHVDRGSMYNRLTQNSLRSNDLSIHTFNLYEGGGPTPNDPGDGDTGPNGIQNYPVLNDTQAAGSTTTVSGSLNSIADQTYTLELFSSPACNPRGNGDAWTYVGTTMVTTDHSGNVEFTVTLPALPAGSVVTATATDPQGNTSELSKCVTVQRAGPGEFRFANPVVTVLEFDSARLTVQRVTGAAGAVTVDYATVDGSATGGTDYISSSGTLHFADGELTKTIDIPFVDDSIYEGTETYTVVLSNATGGATIGTPSTCTVSINDNDRMPGINISDARMAEGNSGTANMLFQVTLTRPSAVTATVKYLTSADTATPGDDYDESEGTLVFPAGETRRTIAVPIHGDTRPEKDETFHVFLSQPTNLFLEYLIPTGTIVNDDVGLLPGSQMVPVGGKAELNLELGNAPAAPLSVVVTSSNATVLDLPASLTIEHASNTILLQTKAAGATTVSIALPPPYGPVSAHVTVYEPAHLVLDPASIVVFEGGTRNVTAWFDPPLSASAVVQLAANNPSTIELPSSVVIGAGQQATFPIRGLQKGSTILLATLGSDHGNQQASYFVDVLEAPKTPVIDAVTPASGPTAGGTNVAIHGMNLTADCTISFDGVPAAHLTYAGANSMTAITPPHRAETVDVVLTCGGEPFRLPRGFTYVAAAPPRRRAAH